jgi:threonine dehydratase
MHGLSYTPLVDISSKSLEAESRIRSHVRRTPVETSLSLSEHADCSVYLKLENQQKTGSFKLRGAFNRMLLLDPAQRAAGVVAASTGNHGAAVACAARTLGVEARIFVPEQADPSKTRSIELQGASLVKIGSDCIESERAARVEAEQQGSIYVSPYNDPEVVAGQGTLGVELHQQVDHLDAVFIAMGGGGLISGAGGYLRSAFPGVEVVACSPEHSAVMHHSLETGRLLDLPSKPTLSDGTAGGVEAGSITFELCQSVVGSSVLISESEIIESMKILVGGHHQLVEGAAAVALAGFLKHHERFRGRSVAIVLCGANIAPDVLREVLS